MKLVFRIRDILERIRIRGSVPLAPPPFFSEISSLIEFWIKKYFNKSNLKASKIWTLGLMAK